METYAVSFEIQGRRAPHRLSADYAPPPGEGTMPDVLSVRLSACGRTRSINLGSPSAGLHIRAAAQQAATKDWERRLGVLAILTVTNPNAFRQMTGVTYWMEFALTDMHRPHWFRVRYARPAKADSGVDVLEVQLVSARGRTRPIDFRSPRCNWLIRARAQSKADNDWLDTRSWDQDNWL